MTTVPSNCPDHSVLRDFHFGNLTESQQNVVAAHLDYCTGCEEYLQQIDRMGDEAVIALRSSGMAVDGSEWSLSQRLPEGLRIGNYEVIEEIGQGGMGIVCKARHVVLQRIVAIKMLISGELANSEYRSRFSAEAEAMARLRHANIVQIYEVGTWERSDGCSLPFLALEYVSGGNLSDRTQGRPQLSGQAAAWIETLAHAVQHAHDHGVVHRDLKPSNILFDSDGQIKLCDFGVAKLIAGSDAHTRTGVLMGTPEYMAPEQAGEGLPVSASTDVWALGAILYTLLTGSPPFVDADAFNVLQKIRLEDPVSPRLLQPAIERDLETVCMKCLRKDVAHRYASALELADDLKRIREGLPIHARPVGIFEQSWKWFKRRPAAATTIAWFVLLATIGLPAVTWLWLRAESARHRADELVERAESALYFNRIALAKQGLESEGIDQTLTMLERCRPAKDSRDRRNWEWWYLNRQAKLGHRDGLKHEQEGDVWTWINDLVWSPNGKRLVSVGGPVLGTTPGKVRIWDSETWHCLTEWNQPGGSVLAVAWHPTQPYIVTGNADGSVVQWDTESNAASRLVWQLPVPDHSIRQLRFSSDGKLLAIGTTAGLFLHDLDEHCDRLVEKADWQGVSSVDFRTDIDESGARSTLLLATFAGKANDGQMAIWDVTTPGSIRRLSLKNRLGPLACGAFTKEDPTVPIAIAEIGSSDVELWNKDGSMFLDRLRGHRGGLLDIKFAGDGSMATAGEDGTIRYWTIATHVEKAVFRGHSDGVRKINFSPGGTQLASCGQDLRICIWDVDQDPRGINFQGTRASGGEFAGGLAFAKEDNALVVVSQASQSVLSYDATNGNTLSSSDVPLIKSYSSARRDQALRADAKQLATSDPEHPEILRIWSTFDGKLLNSLVHQNKPDCVAWSDDGSVLATTVLIQSKPGPLEHSAVDTLVRIWNPQTGEQLKQWSIANERVIGLCVDSRGELVATSISESSKDPLLISPSRVMVWGARSGRVRYQLNGCEGLIPALCFRPDSLQLAAAGLESQEVYTWDLDADQNLLKRPTLTTPTSITYSPDGQRIAVGGYDNRVRIWDSRTPNEAISLHCLGLPGNGNYAFKSWVAFSSDGRRLAATDWKGTVTVWDASFVD